MPTSYSVRTLTHHRNVILLEIWTCVFWLWNVQRKTEWHNVNMEKVLSEYIKSIKINDLQIYHATVIRQRLCESYLYLIILLTFGSGFQTNFILMTQTLTKSFWNLVLVFSHLPMEFDDPFKRLSLHSLELVTLKYHLHVCFGMIFCHHTWVNHMTFLGRIYSQIKSHWYMCTSCLLFIGRLVWNTICFICVCACVSVYVVLAVLQCIFISYYICRQQIILWIK